MKVCVIGDSHLAHYTRIGAGYRGLQVDFDGTDADLYLYAEDTPTDLNGVRDLRAIEAGVRDLLEYGRPVILMSQVPPGFCRQFDSDLLYYYPETLRMKDAYERCTAPEYIIIGYKESNAIVSNSGLITLHKEVMDYCNAFHCPPHLMPYEAAEFAKIAVNMALAAQVDYANRMKAACDKIGADWMSIVKAIRHDKRIGQYAYLMPGNWRESVHLLRDYVTFREIEGDAFFFRTRYITIEEARQMYPSKEEDV